MKDEQLEKLKEKITSKKPSPIPSGDLLSTGSTLLNLACSGKIKGGLPKGGYYLLAGDSMSSKSFTAMTCLAEASISPQFKDHRLIYNDAEGGILMDIQEYFGKSLARKLERPDPAITVEEFYFHLDDIIKEEKPFIYVLDSMDAITSEADEELHQKNKIAHDKDKDASGSFGTAKAKANSNGLRRLMSPLRDMGSILIIISQARDKIGFGFEKNTRSGGRALRFYARLEIWFSVKESIRKTVRGKQREIGKVLEARIKKNRVNGKYRPVELIFHESTGLDDLESICNWLIDENHWSNTKGKISAPEFDFSGSKELLIAKIEENDLEMDLKTLVAKVWQEIEDTCSVQRKKRYE